MEWDNKFHKTEKININTNNKTYYLENRPKLDFRV